ncbi:MAG TPA: glycosyltransferase [Acidimicrobiia bacterium]|nr:glycosyltransferase [Acidimicrobiia bacterium]
MRVLHVINSLSGSGGAEQGMVREITRLGPGIQQMLVRLYPPDQLEPDVLAAGIESVGLGLNSGNSGWNWPAGASRLDRHVAAFQPDVIQTSLAAANLTGQISGRRAGVPVLSTFTLSGDPSLMRRYQPGADLLRAQALRRIEWWSARRDHVWFRALTEDARQTNSAVAGIDPERVTVIPRGVPIPDLETPQPSRADLGLPDGPLVLNVGRQTAQKGHDDLVKAFSRVRERFPAHLVILGREGDGSASLRAAIDDLGLAEAVTVVPFSDRPFDYYRAADVFAFSSHMEGLGTAVLEAMAAGLPVVAYDIPPVREIAGDPDHATLVPLGDVAALADEIVTVIETRQPALEMASRARAAVMASHSLERVSARLEELLREVARRHTDSVSRR